MHAEPPLFDYAALYAIISGPERCFDRRSKIIGKLDFQLCCYYNTDEGVNQMLENPLAKRTAIAAAIGAVIAIPLPFVGPILGAIVGGGIGYFTADKPR